MRFNIITIFPNIFNSYLNESILKRAQKRGLIQIKIHNLRDFTSNKHKIVALRPIRYTQGRPEEFEGRQVQSNREPRRTVDDKPYGGGPGMVLKIEPIYKAVKFLKSKISAKGGKNKKSPPKADAPLAQKTRIILFSLRGRKFDNKIAKRLSRYDHLILICGRYEGVDERVAKYIADEEISIGDYVLAGGELAALVVIEAVSRHLSGVLGKKESLEEIKGSYPVYTRPPIFFPEKNRRARSEEFNNWKVPKVLLLGNHKKIEKWRKSIGRKL